MPKHNRKHILFLSYHLPIKNEPGAFRPWMEARLMAKAGFRVTVVTSGVHYMTGKDIRPYKSWCTEEMISGIRILKTWAPANHRRSIAKRMLNYAIYGLMSAIVAILKVGKVDRVFAGTDPVFMMPAVFLSSIVKRAPMILDERDLYPETAVALGVMSEGCLYRILWNLQEFFRSKSLGVLAATPGIKRLLLSYGHSEDKVKLLFNADAYLYDELNTSPIVLDLRKKTGKEFLIGYAGGLGKANDIMTLLKAAGHLRKNHSIGIVIIGGGEKRLEYISYCNNNEIKNVFFINAIPRKEARTMLKQLDVCVHLYPNEALFKGALASKIFDYHGLSKPMIFCGSGDTRDLLEESGGGISIDSGNDRRLADEILLLWKDRQLRIKMGNAAGQWFRDHIDVEAACGAIKQVIV